MQNQKTEVLSQNDLRKIREKDRSEAKSVRIDNIEEIVTEKMARDSRNNSKTLQQFKVTKKYEKPFKSHKSN